MPGSWEKWAKFLKAQHQHRGVEPPGPQPSVPNSEWLNGSNTANGITCKISERKHPNSVLKGAVEFDTMAMSCRRTSAICENPNHPIGCAPAIYENPNHPIGRALPICENPNHPISAKTSMWWRFPQRARTATLLRSLPLVDCSLQHGQLSLSAIYIELHWMKAGFLLGTDWAYQSRYTVLGRASRETVVWMNRLKRYLVLSWQITNILRNFNSIFILTLANGILLTFKTTVWNHLKVKGAFSHSKEDMPKCRLNPWCGLYCHPHFPFLGNARCSSRVYLPGALVLHHSGSTALDINSNWQTVLICLPED